GEVFGPDDPAAGLVEVQAVEVQHPLERPRQVGSQLLVGAEGGDRLLVQQWGADVEETLLAQWEQHLDVVVHQLQADVVPGEDLAEPSAEVIGRVTAVEVDDGRHGVPRGEEIEPQSHRGHREEFNWIFFSVSSVTLWFNLFPSTRSVPAPPACWR